MEETLSGFFTAMPFLVSFLAGIVTFASPCVLPLVPAYISYISGISLGELQEQKVSNTARTIHILFAACLFILGFSAVFVLLGTAMANLIGDFMRFSWVNYIAGAIIVIFGLHTMGVITIGFLNFEKRAAFGDIRSTSLFAPFILGVSFALGWTPCVGPVFAAIVMKAAQAPHIAVWLMVVYAAGLAVPFLLTALLTGLMFGFLGTLRRYFGVIKIVSGLLLVALGIAIAFGGVSRLTELFS